MFNSFKYIVRICTNCFVLINELILSKLFHYFVIAYVFSYIGSCGYAFDPASMPDEYVIAQAAPEKTKLKEKEQSSSNINDLDQSNITTKIYRSNDPALELLDNPTNINTTTLSDLLPKEELLKGKKIIKQDLASNGASIIRKSLKSTLFPWVVLFGLIMLLSFVFKFVSQAK